MMDLGPVLINDLTTGKYDVTVSVGPSYSTKRIEAADSMMAFVQAVPQAGQVSGDLIARAMDWPGANALADRLEKLLPEGMIDKDVPPEQKQAMQDQMRAQQAAAQEALQLEMMDRVSGIKATDAKAARDAAEAQKTEVETMRLMVEPIAL
jgi:hypothetical protein